MSAGVEDEFSLTGQWKVIGGLSFDYIDKYQGGENNTSLNPLIGLKFTPNEDLDFHVSCPQVPVPVHALALFDDLGEPGPARRIGHGLRVRRDLDGPST